MARTVAVNLAVKGVAAVTAGFAEVAAASKSTASQLEKHSASAGKLGSSMLGMGVIAAGGMALAVKAAMDWQSEWTGVAKTVDGTTDQLNALQGSLRQMAKEIPASAKEIAGVAEAAGQLGVAAGDVASFTRVMIDLGNTTNLTSTEAASSLAELMNIMGTAGKDVGRLGATVVALGNNGASTERDIVAMGLRIAGAGRAIGMSEAQTLAYASALSSVGIEAEAGGSAISQAFIKMDDAVRAGGAGLQLLADTSGMSAEQFQQAWGTDAAQAMNVFIKGLARIQSQGGSTFQVLSDLGLGSIRQSDAMRRLASAGDLVTESLKTGESAWSANSALVIEATKRYSTAESRITMAWNRINDAAITAGGKILPMVAGLADGAGKAADAFGNIPGPVLSVLGSLGMGVAVIGLAGGGILKLASAGAGAKKAFDDMSTSFPRASAAMSTVGKAAGVVAIALVALTAAVAAVQAMDTKNAFGGLDEAVGIMAELSGSADLAGSGIDKFFKNATPPSGFWATSTTADIVTGVNSLETAFTRLNKPGLLDQINNVGQSIAAVFGAKTDVSKITDQFKKLDSGLTAMAAGGGADQAAAAFKKVADASKDMDPQKLIDLFPEYQAQIRAAGTAAGYTYTSSAELAAAMQGVLPAGMSATQKAAVLATGAIKAEAFSMDDLVKSMFEVTDAALKTSGTQIGFETAILDAAKAANETTVAQKKSGEAISLTTEKGLANRTVLNQMAQATMAYAAQLTATNAETSVVVGTVQRGRDAFIASAIAMGFSAAGAAALADEMHLLPAETKLALTTPGASESRQSVEDLKTSIAGLKPETQAWILTKLERQGIAAAYAELNAISGKTVSTYINVIVRAPAGNPGGNSMVAMAGADGMVIEPYARGGLRENHVAQIARAGAWRLWAEDETGGESYIPLAREKWPRSREIWWETGKHLGLVANADGALYGGGQSMSVPNVTVGGSMANVQVLLDGRELRHEMRVTFSEESAKRKHAEDRGRR